MIKLMLICQEISLARTNGAAKVFYYDRL